MKGYPAPQGLYDPQHEHDACGVGFICHIKGQPSHQIVKDALEMLHRLSGRVRTLNAELEKALGDSDREPS